MVGIDIVGISPIIAGEYPLLLSLTMSNYFFHSPFKLISH